MTAGPGVRARQPERNATPRNALDVAEVYVALTSGVVDGIAVAFRRSDRLRGSHAVVQAAPLMFVDDGTPSDDASRIAAERSFR